MSLPKTVVMTRSGGNYWRAVVFRYTVSYVALPFVLVALALAILNPFWFRESFFSWVSQSVDQLCAWRNYRQYAIYLGTDPHTWHAVKGE